AGRARLLGAGLAMTVAASGVGAYTSGAAFASPSNDTTATARQGAPLDYPVVPRMMFLKDRGTAKITPIDSVCATNLFRGEVRAWGSQGMHAFNADQSWSCLPRFTRAKFKVEMNGMSGEFVVQQWAPMSYIAFCQGALGCTPTSIPAPPPMGLTPSVAFW
ncbi:MAG TPA: hypothetical protein VF005_07915, partial [Acidimicrobiales bacterium]